MNPQNRMHPVLNSIIKELEATISQIGEIIPNDEPLGINQNSACYPCLTRSDLVSEAELIIEIINDRGGITLGEGEALLTSYIPRLKHLRETVIRYLLSYNGEPVFAYFLTLQGLRNAVDLVLPLETSAKLAARLKKLAAQVRSIEARLKDVGPRTMSLGAMVEGIERAHATADQLPTVLEDLTEARQEMEKTMNEVEQHQKSVVGIKENVVEFEKELKRNAEEAASVLARCETAYSAATSVGLAAAFSERSNALSKSIRFWVGGLVFALITSVYLGVSRLHSLVEVFSKDSASPQIITINLLLSVLSVGAPVWFAWLATKQVGQRFRLAEDYGFKASISRAYEGFRREAAKVDKEMESRLLASALARFDELPLRLVESSSYGSPWHELMASDTVRGALRIVPGFSDKIKNLAAESLYAISERVRPTKQHSKRNSKKEVVENG